MSASQPLRRLVIQGMSAQDLARSKRQGGPGFVLHGQSGSGAGCLGSLCSLHPRRSAGPKRTKC